MGIFVDVHDGQEGVVCGRQIGAPWEGRRTSGNVGASSSLFFGYALNDRVRGIVSGSPLEC